MSTCAVVVPLYRPVLAPFEEFSLAYSLRRLAGRDLVFVVPAGLNLEYYRERYPHAHLLVLDPAHFASIHAYSRLLLKPEFYQYFAAFEFILLLQTDAIILRDELTRWLELPFDYVGAPWPKGHELFVNTPPFDGNFGKHIKVHVGNGGLSLRRNAACIELLREFPSAAEVFIRTGSNEDMFFSYMGSLSKSFVLPNEITASLFALELEPEYYFGVNQGTMPMGGHAWWRYSLDFWKQQIEPLDGIPFPW